MKKIHCRDPRFHFVDLENNVGENWALLAGVSKARGDVLVTIDGDYQNDPAYIPALFDELSKGYRVVSGRRRERVEHLWSRLVPSQIANGLIRFVSRVAGARLRLRLKAYRREVLENKFVPDGYMNRFSPAALGVRRHEFAEVEVIDRPRISGQSHYGLNRVFFVLRDLIALPFALRGAVRWRKRFCWLKWLSLAIAPPLVASGHLALGAATVALSLLIVFPTFGISAGLFRAKRIPRSASKSISEIMNDKVSVALVGAGYWGKKLLPKFVRNKRQFG